MNRFARVLLLSIFLNFIYVLILYAQTPTAKDKQLVLKKCAQCHDVAAYINPRSAKAWELTVYDMQDMGWDEEEPFSDEEAEKIIDYLSFYFGEGSEIDSYEHFEQEFDIESGKVKQKPPIIRKRIPKELQEQLTRWKPFSPELLAIARVSGFASVLFLLGLILTGHSRKKLKERFRPVHIFLALSFFIALAIHGVIYLFRYGNPPVAWYWFGIVSFGVLILAELQGIVRKKMGPKFLKIHVASGYAGILLAILHWILAWI